MATFVRVGTGWQPASTARPGRRHSIFGSRRIAPGTPHDRRDIVALVPRRPSNVNVTMPVYKHWSQIFNNDSTLTSAILDRVHHADTVVIEGPSFHMKDEIEA
jgi:hypothetical protein